MHCHFRIEEEERIREAPPMTTREFCTGAIDLLDIKSGGRKPEAPKTVAVRTWRSVH